jgi:hypothetical protein
MFVGATTNPGRSDRLPFVYETTSATSNYKNGLQPIAIHMRPIKNICFRNKDKRESVRWHLDGGEVFGTVA